MNNRVLRYSSFHSINEGHSISKSDVGVLGPFSDGRIKIQIPHSGQGKIILTEEADSSKLTYCDREVSIPSKCLRRTTSPGFDVVTVNTNMNWFNDEENSTKFYDFLEEYISDEFARLSPKVDYSSGDIELIMASLGIDSPVSKSNMVDKNLYEFDLENGMQVELSKKGGDDLFKTLRVYKSDADIHPGFTLKRKGGKFNCKYRTDSCSHETAHDKFDQILADPVDSYLISVTTGGDHEDSQKGLVDHLLKMLKYHSWGDDKQSSVEKNSRERSEIIKLMDILKNTIPESHIEEMYTDARSKFSPR